MITDNLLLRTDIHLGSQLENGHYRTDGCWEFD